MATRKLEVQIVGDSKSLERAFTRSSAAATGFNRNITTTGRSVDKVAGGLGSLQKQFVGGIAIGAVAAGIKNLSDSASDLNEQISKSQQVFGASSREIEDWAKTTAESFGISRTEALAATGTFGNLFNTVGIVGRRAGKMSEALVQLAADLASFNNASPTDTLDAIRSGLIGEAEPLRRYGVLLSEARVQQRALADTGKDTASSLTQQEKALARYEIILGDTKKAQGDFGRTSGELANQQRIMRARFADTSAELGGRLLPIMLKVTEGANRLLSAFDKTPQSDVLAAFADERFRKDLAKLSPDAYFKLLEKAVPAFNEAVRKFSDIIQPIELKIRPAADLTTPAFGQPGFKPGKAAEVLRPGVSVEQRNRIFENAISRALFRNQSDNDAKELAGLRTIEKQIEARIDATKDVTRKLKLEDDLIAVQRQEQALREAIRSDAATKLENQRAIRLKREQTSAARIQASQFRALGLAADGSIVVPGVENLQKQLAGLKSKDLSSQVQSQLVRVGKVLSGSFGKVTRESREAIQNLFSTIRGEFDKGTKGPLTKTTGLDTKKILQGLGLAPADERELRARLSRFNSAGVGNARAPVVESHVTVQVDGQTLGQVTTRAQQKTRKRNPAQRRGPNRGAF